MTLPRIMTPAEPLYGQSCCRKMSLTSRRRAGNQGPTNDVASPSKYLKLSRANRPFLDLFSICATWFHEEEMLEDEVDEVPEKVLEVVGYAECVGAATCLSLVGWWTTVSPQNVAVQVHALPLQMALMAVHLPFFQWIRIDDLKVLPPGPSTAEIALRQWKDLVAILWKIVSSLSRAELDACYWIVRRCPESSLI
ncbi:hypothetical protein Acr_05g0001100 [Actinidia rufa]|uniref:Uncharacterized protein n=1 Tax=Actinidia rufa TaxID=165716 RepID=A0A7J0EJ31_9ERIC|nr:hypothetical protein Acr_05g0001100 [Actinidia rufa]